MDRTIEEAIAQAHREEWARVVGTLTRRFGDLDAAKDAAAEAFATSSAAARRSFGPADARPARSSTGDPERPQWRYLRRQTASRR